jgi:glutamine synthetase
MVRVPIGNERSARVEVRSVGPDANPYLVLLAVFATGLNAKAGAGTDGDRYLPDNIYDALAAYRESHWAEELMGADIKEKYAGLKQASADRCARLLGNVVKSQEVQFHHEVYNQYLWGLF